MIWLFDRIEDLLKESDDDEDETMKSKIDAKSQKSTKTSKTNSKDKEKVTKASTNGKHDAWLQENESEDPLDLLDPMAIKHVFATKPLTKEEILKKKSKDLSEKSKNRGFKTTSDGKLLIEDDEDEDDNFDKKSKVKKNKKPDELDEMMDTLSLSKKSTTSKKSKSKRALDGDDSDDDVVEDKKSKFSYKAGGSGIHRKIVKKEQADYGSEYKSKVTIRQIDDILL